MSWPHRPSADWLDAAEAAARVHALFSPLDPEKVPLERALGRTLAEPIRAGATLPPWDNSAMDGYAVRGDDLAGASQATPVELAVVGEARAGEPWRGVIRSGEALRIMTGAPVPTGADTVVRVEDTDGERSRGRVRIDHDRDRGRNVRPAGQDMREGDLLLEAGEPLTPGGVALAAAAGTDPVRVHRRPRVGILTSGDELRSSLRFADVRDGRGIPDSNGPLLVAAASELGAEAVPLGPVPDRAADVRATLDRARGAALDLLVTVGGASMGATDLFHGVLREMGASLDFWRVRIRPGSPFSAGLLPRPDGSPLPVLGLPGNPASAFVTFHLFARPALLRLSGRRRLETPAVPARAGAPLRGGGELTHFLRVRLETGEHPWAAVPTGPQGSGLVRGLAFADGLAVVPPGVEEIGTGEEVSVLLLRLPPGAPT